MQVVQELIVFSAEKRSGSNNSVVNRAKREYSPDPQVYIDGIGQHKLIPNEYKARHEVKSGFEAILPWVTTNKNTEWINFIYYNQQHFINYTHDALISLGEQVDATSALAWQNRLTLDWLLAEKGAVCEFIGEYCCTFIPGHTSPEGDFTKAKKKLRSLRMEVMESEG